MSPDEPTDGLGTAPETTETQPTEPAAETPPAEEVAPPPAEELQTDPPAAEEVPPDPPPPWGTDQDVKDWIRREIEMHASGLSVEERKVANP